MPAESRTRPVIDFRYARSTNLGDDIQSLAVLQHLDLATIAADRDELDAVDVASIAVMQGWFTKRSDTFPLPPTVAPVWIGFHLDPTCYPLLARDEVRAMLLRGGPVGCRDAATAAALHRFDIPADVSGCLTTTFPTRPPRTGGRTYLVDVVGAPIPNELRTKDAVRVTHEGATWWSAEAKRRLADDLLRRYRDDAARVITSRIHCALPCAAMGIPVVFVGDCTDPRIGALDGLVEVAHVPTELRGDSWRARWARRSHARRDLGGVDWEGRSSITDEHKAVLVERLQQGVGAVRD